MTFLVQVGKGSKGSYKTRWSFESLERAVLWYSGINIGRGYKKRIIVAETRQLFARAFS